MATNVVLPFSRSASSSESQKFTPKGFNGSRTLKMAGPGITTTAGRGSAAAVKAATGPQGSVVKRGGGGKEMDASRDSSDKRSSAKNIDPARCILKSACLAYTHVRAAASALLFCFMSALLRVLSALTVQLQLSALYIPHDVHCHAGAGLPQVL